MAGRAGAVRAALKLARIKYENDFVDRDSMQELKPRLPFGQVPVFEVNGEIVAQSNAFFSIRGQVLGVVPGRPLRRAQGGRDRGRRERLHAAAQAEPPGEEPGQEAQ